MNLTLSPSQLPVALEDILSAGLVPMIHGEPGVAKSDCVNQFAVNKNLFCETMTLSTKEPTDIDGFPVRSKDGDRMTFVPLDQIPLEGDQIPKGYDGFCLFLDEFNSAPRMVQAAAYRLVLDRRAGRRKLHPRCVVVCAGNNQGDNAIVNDLSTAMQSRLVHLELEMNHVDWLAWASSNNIDHRVMSFIEARPELLHKFEPNHDDRTFACARTWHFLSKYIKNKKTFSGVDSAVMAGTVSTAVSTEFRMFCKLYKVLPTIDELIASPETVSLSTDPSHQYALSMLVSHNMDASNIDQLMKVVVRIGIDFQVVLLRDVFAKGKVDKQHPLISSWIKNHASIMF